MSDDALIQKLQKTRPGYEDECVWHKFLIDSYTGGGGFRGKVRQPPSGYWGWAAEQYAQHVPSAAVSRTSDGRLTYLDRHPREAHQKFSARVDVSHYLNYVEPLTSLKTSFMLRKSPHEKIPESLTGWLEDVDGAGNAYKRFQDRLAERTAVVGWIPVLVEMPQHAATTRAQADQLSEQGMRTMPTVYSLLPMHLLDYQLDEGGEFIWAKVRTAHERREDNRWDGAPIQVERYRIWTRDRVITYEVHRREDKKASIERADEEEHDYGRVPIEICKYSETEEDPLKSEPMHGDAAIECRRLFNLLSEFDEHIRSQIFAILVVCGDVSGGGESGEVTVGPDQALPLSNEAKHKHYYLSPDPGLAKVFEDRIERTIQEIYRTARVEYEKPSGANKSASSRRQAFEATNAAIQAFAEQMADFKRRLLTFVARLMSVPGPIEVTAPDRFDIGDIETEVSAIMDVLDLEAGPTARKKLLIRAVTSVLPNLDPDTKKAIEDEVSKLVEEENTPEARRQREQERAMLTAGGEPDDDDEADGDEEEDEDGERAA